MAGNCKRGQCVLSSGYRIWSVPDPGYRLQGACTCPVPVRYLYPMRRTGGGGGTKPTPGGPTKVGPAGLRGIRCAVLKVWHMAGA